MSKVLVWAARFTNTFRQFAWISYRIKRLVVKVLYGLERTSRVVERYPFQSILAPQ